MENREVFEAKRELEKSLSMISEIREDIRSAKRWGIFDILGGGLIASLVKRDKIGKINTKLDNLEVQLKKTMNEVDDVPYLNNVRISNDFIDQLFDMGFDNIFTDISTQLKLKDAEKNLEGIEQDLTDLLEEIERRS